MPLIDPYFQLPVQCLEYDSQASEVAHFLAQMIREIEPWVIVEHVGSTAIPNCAGKGVIDIMISFTNEQELSNINDALASLGYQHHQHHANCDRLSQNRLLRTGSIQYKGRRYRIHAHVIPLSHPELIKMRTFRDKLRADPNLVAAYVTHKLAILAQGIDESDKYAKAKTKFVKDVLAG